MTATYYFRRQGRRAFARAAEGQRAPTLPGAVISAVIEFADLKVDLGAGQVRYQISQTRLGEAPVRAALGEHVGRAAQVSVVWDEREDQIARVIDDSAFAWAA